MIELVCIACPQGCRLKVDDQLNVTGFTCERGEAYGRNEVQNPQRVVTSTVRVTGGAYRRCPVRTSTSIPKRLVIDSVQALNGVCIHAPVRSGQVIIANVCDTQADFIATRDIPSSNEEDT